MRKIVLTIFLAAVSAFSGNAFAQGIKYPSNEDTVRFIVRNDPVRFFGGTFWTGIEIPIQNKNSILVSGIVTYGSPMNDSKQLIGWGGELQYRNYLGKGSFITKVPLYLAPQLIVRRIEEYNQVYNWDLYYNGEPNITESKRGFTVIYGGLLLGAQVFVNNIFTIDINFGGGLRLTQINDESGFSRYKSLTGLDYSGVVPRIGVQIGIVHH
jgi:hypothetical protein